MQAINPSFMTFARGLFAMVCGRESKSVMAHGLQLSRHTYAHDSTELWHMIDFHDLEPFLATPGAFTEYTKWPIGQNECRFHPSSF